MKPIHVTFEGAVLAMKKAVADKGEDYVYPRQPDLYCGNMCVYYNQDASPSCLVGHVLAEAGGRPFSYTDVTNKTAVVNLVASGVVSVDRVETIDLLQEAQCLQDSSVAWGPAVAKATRHRSAS